jgi:hypothetical protein
MIGRPEASVNNNQSAIRKIPEERICKMQVEFMLIQQNPKSIHTPCTALLHFFKSSCFTFSCCAVPHTSYHNTLYPGGDGLLGVGVCNKLLVYRVHLKGSKQMEIDESHTANQTCH